MVTGLNESKILKKHISYKCKYKFDSIICNSNQKRNNDNKCRWECRIAKENNVCEKDYIWNSVACIFENVEYLVTSVEDSAITCDEIIKDSDTVLTNVPTNDMSIASINFHNIIVRYKMDCYILNMVVAKLIRIRLDKIDGFIRVYNESRCLVLFGLEKHDTVYNRTRYLISLKSSTTYVFSRYYPKIRADSYDSLPLITSLL